MFIKIKRRRYFKKKKAVNKVKHNRKCSSGIVILENNSISELKNERS